MGLGELKVQLQSYASNKYVQGSKEFLQSNSIVAKFAFLILVVILFSLFFRFLYFSYDFYTRS